MLPEKCAVARCTPSNKKTSCRAVRGSRLISALYAAGVVHTIAATVGLCLTMNRLKKLLPQREPRHGRRNLI